jgi:hypothetical protein
MAKKLKNIILAKKKTKVSIIDLDGWLFDLTYRVNGKETYNCQIIKTDLPGRIKRLEAEGFARVLNKKQAREFIEEIEKSC